MGDAGAPNELLADLVAEYRLALDAGRNPSLEQLCQDRPELRKQLAYAIAESQRLEAWLEGDDAADPPPPAQGVAGRYERPQRVTAGGMGELFRATDVEASREVAYKVLRPELDLLLYREFFLTEARLTAALAHPAVVPIYGVLADSCGRPAYAMEFIAGETFDEAISRLGGTETGLRKLLGYFVTVARAVAHAHEQRITHGDIKSQNVRIRTDEKPFVVDWGLARRHPDSVPPNALVADITGLSKLLAEILAGRPVPPALAATRTAALAFRHRSAEALASAVQQWLDTGGTPDYRDFWTVRVLRWANRRQALATILVALVCGLPVTAAALVWYNAEQERKRAELEATTQQAASSREWALYQAGMVSSMDALRHYLTPQPGSKQLGIARAREARDNFAKLVAAYPDQLAHRVRWHESQYILGFFLLQEDQIPEGEAEVRAAEAGFTSLAGSAPRFSLVLNLGTSPEVLSAETLRRRSRVCRIGLAIAILKQRRAFEAFELLDGVIRERGIDVPPLERPFDPIARQQANMKIHKQRYQEISAGIVEIENDQPAEVLLAQRETALMMLEIESGAQPYSRGPKVDHARAMRELSVMAAAARVSDPAVFNTACAFALASVEPGISPAEQDRRATAALGYLSRLLASGYFLDAKPLRELQTDADLQPLRVRQEYQDILANARQQWAIRAAVGCGFGPVSARPPARKPE